MLTLKRVNKAIAPLGDIVLHKGNGYYYFIGLNASADKPGVYVNTLNCLPLDRWIDEAKDRLVADE